MQPDTSSMPATMPATPDESPAPSWLPGTIAGVGLGGVVGLVAFAMTPAAKPTARPDRLADESMTAPIERVAQAEADAGVKPRPLPLSPDAIASLAPVPQAADTPQSAAAPQIGDSPQAFRDAYLQTVSDERPDRFRMIDALVANELPHATPDEVAIWREALEGLSLQDARGILRMRSQLGSPAPLTPLPSVAIGPRPSPLAMPAITPPATRPATVPVAASPSTSDALAVAAAAARRNLKRQDCLAYLADYVLISETADGAGVRVIDRRLHDEPGPAIYTGRPLDVSLTGPVFLAVRVGDQTQLTRYGRLSVEDGTVGVDLPDGFAPLDPPVRLDLQPGQTVTISDDRAASLCVDGQPQAPLPMATVADVGALQRGGAMLYRPTDATGPIVPAEGGARPAHLTGSNVMPDIEADRLSYLEDRLRGRLHQPQPIRQAGGERPLPR